MEQSVGLEPSVWSVLLQLAAHPWQRIVRRWNWKSAALSALLRGGIFVAVSLHSQHSGGRLSAFLTESVWACLSAGLYGTLAQALRSARPKWLAFTILGIVLPAISQVAEVFSHLLAGSAVFHNALVASAIFSALSAAFNLYAMQHGTLLAGDEGDTFVADLKRLPVLVFEFLVAIVRAPIRWFTGLFAEVHG